MTVRLLGIGVGGLGLVCGSTRSGIGAGGRGCLELLFSGGGLRVVVAGLLTGEVVVHLILPQHMWGGCEGSMRSQLGSNASTLELLTWRLIFCVLTMLVPSRRRTSWIV